MIREDFWFLLNLNMQDQSYYGNGHRWERTPYLIKKGHWCSKCSHDQNKRTALTSPNSHKKITH